MRRPAPSRFFPRSARRAYRGPVSDKDLETLLSFYQIGRNRSNFEYGIENALRLILASPKFIFRYQPDPAGAAPGSVYRVSDLELASRLSFFLWSSIPDDQLLDLAAQGKLKDPAVLEQQVKRMLADPRAEALVTNFAGQWLYLRNLQSVSPNEDDFPNFDDNLRQAMRRETELFFESIMREDRNVLDLLNADYTFVNDRLAKHYGIPNIYGSQFRRVTITDENRRGLLGQASILTVTSQPNRTSPVLRGKWILENLMGTPPPPPPPNVPPLKENEEGAKAQSVRALLEEHRKNPPCSTCHSVMDPLGFSLENFDAIGKWRAKDASGPVDASGQLADGTAVNGPVALRAGADEASGAVRPHHDRKADDLRPGPGLGILRHAHRALDRTRGRRQQLPLLGADSGDRQEHAVPDEKGAGGGRRDRRGTVKARDWQVGDLPHCLTRALSSRYVHPASETSHQVQADA